MRIKEKKIIEDLHDNVMFNMKLVRRHLIVSVTTSGVNLNYQL